jgi:hypothetical protein
MIPQAKGPATPSGDHAAMSAYWQMVGTILDGADAMRAAGVRYLPQFPNESAADYEYRRKHAKFTNIYRDIVESLASKPFTEKVALSEDDAPERLAGLVEDIDGRGNNLHVFASQVFFAGINNAVDWVLVEYSRARPAPGRRPLTAEEEKAQGLRPYWVHIPAPAMLAVYTDTIDGREQIVHARFREDRLERDGYGERKIERIRILDRDRGPAGYGPARYEVWEKPAPAADAPAPEWRRVDEGTLTLGVIPLVPFVTGRRKEGSWQFVPPLKDAAFLQIEHYQQETALKSIKELTAFPMLAGNGVAPQMIDGKPAAVPVGPKSVLYAPPSADGNHGEWAFIEPTAASLKFLAEDVKATEEQLRELGRQPLTATAGITVVTAALASQKASSAVQAWAWGLKDALEQALKLTCLWLGDSESQPTVNVFTDFEIGTEGDQGPAMLTAMRKDGDLSQETLWSEAKRRGVLSADFDADDERKRLMDEMPGDDDLDDQRAALAA